MLARLDRVQRRHPVLGFTHAVVRKYLDDDGSREAALLTYYGFLSLFPVLLLVVGTVAVALAGHPDERERLIAAIVPPTLLPGVRNSLSAMPSGHAALAAGAVGLTLSGIGVVLSAYRTLNHVAAVPYADRACLIVRYVRAVAALVVILAGTVGAGTLTVVAADLPMRPWPARITAVAGSGAVAFLALCLVARLLLARPAPLRALWPAAVPGAVAVALVLHLGVFVVPHFVRRAGLVYGGFAAAAGAFSLLYLLSVALVGAAEVAAVREAGLWPRALDQAQPTEADVRARTLLVRELRRTGGEAAQLAES